MRVSVVGPCGSGKSTLVEGLRAHGYDARECVQEHSYVPTMWVRISNPDVLVYLDVSLKTLYERKPGHAWTSAILDEQKQRLAHARISCDLYLDSDHFAQDSVLQQTLAFLAQLNH